MKRNFLFLLILFPLLSESQTLVLTKDSLIKQYEYWTPIPHTAPQQYYFESSVGGTRVSKEKRMLTGRPEDFAKNPFIYSDKVPFDTFIRFHYYGDTAGLSYTDARGNSVFIEYRDGRRHSLTQGNRFIRYFPGETYDMVLNKQKIPEQIRIIKNQQVIEFRKDGTPSFLAAVGDQRLVLKQVGADSLRIFQRLSPNSRDWRLSDQRQYNAQRQADSAYLITFKNNSALQKPLTQYYLFKNESLQAYGVLVDGDTISQWKHAGNINSTASLSIENLPGNDFSKRSHALIMVNESNWFVIEVDSTQVYDSEGHHLSTLAGHPVKSSPDSLIKIKNRALLKAASCCPNEPMDAPCLIVRNGKKGLINTYGQWILPCEYDEIKGIDNNRNFYLSKQHLIAIKDSIVHVFIYDNLRTYPVHASIPVFDYSSNGKSLYAMNGKKLQTTDCSIEMQDGVIRFLQKGRGLRLITNHRYEPLVDLRQFYSVREVNHQFYFFGDSAGRIGLLNRHLKQLAPAKSWEISVPRYPGDEHYWTREAGHRQWHLHSPDNPEGSADSFDAPGQKSGIYQQAYEVQIKQKWGLIDAMGRLLTEPVYDCITAPFFIQNKVIRTFDPQTGTMSAPLPFCVSSGNRKYGFNERKIYRISNAQVTDSSSTLFVEHLNFDPNLTVRQKDSLIHSHALNVLSISESAYLWHYKLTDSIPGLSVWHPGFVHSLHKNSEAYESKCSVTTDVVFAIPMDSDTLTAICIASNLIGFSESHNSLFFNLMDPMGTRGVVRLDSKGHLIRLKIEDMIKPEMEKAFKSFLKKKARKKHFELPHDHRQMNACLYISEHGLSFLVEDKGGLTLSFLQLKKFLREEYNSYFDFGYDGTDID